MIPFFIAASAYLIAIVVHQLISPKLVPTQMAKDESMTLEAFRLDDTNALVSRFAKAWAPRLAVALAEAGLMWDAMGAILTRETSGKAISAADANLTFPEICGREGSTGFLKNHRGVWLAGHPGEQRRGIHRAPAAEYPMELGMN